ncbi:MAG: hypothetical protein ACI37Q_07370 [Candidatus Gastranaerophilaceae bacterium]
MSNASLFVRMKDYIARNYGKNNVGKMLLHTGVISWILSSAAQVMAIAINDKIPKEQKLYLIPQECADAAVNIVSFYALTKTFKSLGSYLVKTGKLVPGSVRKILKDTNFKDIGKIGTDIAKDANLPAEELKNFERFSSGMDFMFTTLGSIISCNIVTPLVRNQIAADRQKKGIAKMNEAKDECPSQINSTYQYLQKPSMVDFQAKYQNRPYPLNSGALKI